MIYVSPDVFIDLLSDVLRLSVMTGMQMAGEIFEMNIAYFVLIVGEVLL